MSRDSVDHRPVGKLPHHPLGADRFFDFIMGDPERIFLRDFWGQQIPDETVRSIDDWPLAVMPFNQPEPDECVPVQLLFRHVKRKRFNIQDGGEIAVSQFPDDADEMVGLLLRIPGRGEEVVGSPLDVPFPRFFPIIPEPPVAHGFAFARFHVHRFDRSDLCRYFDRANRLALPVRHDLEGIPDDPVSVVMGDVDAENTGSDRDGRSGLDTVFRITDQPDDQQEKQGEENGSTGCESFPGSGFPRPLWARFLPFCPLFRA